MIALYTAEQIRAAEQPLIAAQPTDALMKKAAFAVALSVIGVLKDTARHVAGRQVCLWVGSGNNGGDALYAGSFLARRGVYVTALRLGGSTHPRARDAFCRAGGRFVTDIPPSTDVVVDGIIGIGGVGPLREPAASAVAKARKLGIPVVAVDIPSGIDATTGEVSAGAVEAFKTVTFGAPKVGAVLASAQCGHIDLIDIGLDMPVADTTRQVWQADPEEVASQWPVPGMYDDKYSQGVLGICAGSEQYPGAGVLCATAAVATTSAMVRFVGPAHANVVAALPEIVATSSFDDAGRVQAWVIGPGFGDGDCQVRVLHQALSSDVPILLDADALTVLAANDTVRQAVISRDAPTILTPHAGEFTRIAGRKPGLDRLASVRALAASLQCTVLLKGYVTIIADPNGRAGVNVAGGAWEATPGSGDVLSGMIGKLMASGHDPFSSALMATFVHSRAADLAADSAPTSASGIASHITAAIRQLRRRYLG